MSDDNDEDISIDFSKIKGWFKKKEGPEQKKEQQETKIADDEIDFSKITGFFKKKSADKELSENKQKTAKVEAKGSGEDEDINIDFSKFKGWFKKNEDAKAVKNDDEEDIIFDFKSIKNIFKAKDEKDEDSVNVAQAKAFYKKHKSIILPALLIFIAISINIYLSIQPAYLPITDVWAKDSVQNQFKSAITSAVDKQYPNLPSANRASLADTEYKKFLKQNDAQIDQQIKATSEYFKQKFKDEQGNVYLGSIDPYFWTRHAQNIIKNGHPGDELRDGRPYDNHMFAPLGRPMPNDMFHAYFLAYLYKFENLFVNADIYKVASSSVWILSILCIIPAFFIGRRFAGNFGGFVAALMVAIHPSFVAKVSFGLPDNDAEEIMFPLLITWLMLEAFESKSYKKIALCSLMAGLLVGLFSIAWAGGWFYIFDFILAVIAVYVVFTLAMHIKDISKAIKSMYPALFMALIFVTASASFITIFADFSTFTGSFIAGPLGFVHLKQVGISSIWPNVFTTVAEQNPGSLNSVISDIGTGSIVLFLISLIGILLTTFRKETKKAKDLAFIICAAAWFVIVLAAKPQNLAVFLTLISLPLIARLVMILISKEEDVDTKASILLILWFVSTIYASVKGIRFTLLAVPAFAIALGVAFGWGYYYTHRLISGGLKVNSTISKISVMILFSLFLLGPFQSASAIVKHEVPLINDEWYESLQKINNEADSAAIINSWWDYGHWFKAIGDRAVTFDGTSQESPNVHWIGSVLLTSDEDSAVGILRMVDCGQDLAYIEINNRLKDQVQSIDLIRGIVKVGYKDAEQILSKEGFTAEERQKILNYSHCNPPEDYFITSYDMVGKSGVWAHFGSWDFDRSYIFNTLQKEGYNGNPDASVSFLQQRFNYSKEDAEKIYYDVNGLKSNDEVNSWIAPWPSYSGTTPCSKIDNKTINCPIGQGIEVKVDVVSLQANIETTQGIKHPDSVVMPQKDGSIKEKMFNDTIGVSMVIIPEDGRYIAVLSSKELANSMFTRLFFLNGQGTAHFEKFSDLTDITGGRIIVWKVDWEGKQKNLLEEYIPKPALNATLANETKPQANLTTSIKATNLSVNSSKVSLNNS